MSHGSSLIAIVVIGLGLAFVLATIANRLGISIIVGYLLAGVAVGPFTPGFVADQNVASQLAEIGVILLMFGVGLHFSLQDLLSVRRIVIPGAVAQIAVSALLGMGLARLLGWPLGTGIVFGLALSVASTVVLMHALQDRRLVETGRGQIAIGWLVVQDLLTVLALVLLPPLAGLLRGEGGVDAAGLVTALGLTIGKVMAFIALMLLVGHRVIPAILHYIAHTGSRELFRLAVLAVAVGGVLLAPQTFRVSLPLGAFFAGMVLSESELSQRAAEESLPLRDAFAVLFFISVGMLFNPIVLVHEIVPLLGTLLVVMVGGPCAALLMVRAFGYPLATAVMIGIGLAQIGEFSFILADLGIGLGLLPERARDLILGTSIVSIFANPILYTAMERLKPRIERWDARRAPPPPEEVAEEELPVSGLSDHAVLVGHGRVGSLLAVSLKGDGWPLLVIEEGAARAEALRAQGLEAISGNAAQPRVLKAANLPQAHILLVAIPDVFEGGQIVEQARAANPGLDIIARAHSEAEAQHLMQHGASSVVMGEREIARTMLEHARERRALFEPGKAR
jgi:monovalent cation:H+ antiporter-2, CPA2 family